MTLLLRSQDDSDAPAVLVLRGDLRELVYFRIDAMIDEFVAEDGFASVESEDGGNVWVVRAPAWALELLLTDLGRFGSAVRVERFAFEGAV